MLATFMTTTQTKPMGGHVEYAKLNIFPNKTGGNISFSKEQWAVVIIILMLFEQDGSVAVTKKLSGIPKLHGNEFIFPS